MRARFVAIYCVTALFRSSLVAAGQARTREHFENAAKSNWRQPNESGRKWRASRFSAEWPGSLGAAWRNACAEFRRFSYRQEVGVG